MNPTTPTATGATGTTGTPAIEATGLRKTYGDKVVLDGIALHVPRRTIFSLLGPNGAGKTTTVQILSTLISADGGGARVAAPSHGEPLRAQHALLPVDGEDLAVVEGGGPGDALGAHGEGGRGDGVRLGQRRGDHRHAEQPGRGVARAAVDDVVAAFVARGGGDRAVGQVQDGAQLGGVLGVPYAGPPKSAGGGHCTPGVQVVPPRPHWHHEGPAPVCPPAPDHPT